ncbi:MAG: hypothetical protein AB8B87_09890 [Granulosicoccus sp.]
MSLMQVHVNVAYDPTLGMNSHTLWATMLPVPAPSTPTFAFEMIATQMWTAGYFLGKNKFTDTVKHRKFPICQGDHDIGILIPDVTIPFVNFYYLIMWPFSSRKMAFSTSTVKFDGKPVGCSQIAPIPLPMMTCGDPFTLPTAFPIINWLNELKVGMTLKDLLLGIAQIAVSIAIDAIFNKLGKPKGGADAAKKAAKEAAEEAAKRSVASQVARALLPQVAGKLGIPLSPLALAKKGVNALAGFGFSVAQGNPTFKVGVGGGPVPELSFTAGGNEPATDVLGVPGLGIGNTPTNDPLHIVTDPE